MWRIHAPTVLSGLNALSYWFNSQKSDWQTSPLGHWGSAGISDTGMFHPSISSPTSFPAHRQHTRKNKQQIRYQKKKKKKKKKSCLLLAHMEVAQIWWWREGSCGSLLPGRGPRFDPQSTGVLPAQRSECSAAEQSMGLATPHHHHHPPEDDRCSVRSLQQGESIRHLYNWLRMREKKGKRDGKESEKQGEVGSWHRQGWLSLNRTSFHTHYTCPLQSSHRTGTGAAPSEKKNRGPHFWLMKLPVCHGGVVQPRPKTTNVIQSLSATELFQGFNIRAYPSQ